MAKQHWMVLRAGEQRRWGGEIRRQEIFGRLAARTGASVVDGWPALRRELLGGRLRRVADRVGLRPPPAAQRPLAASEQAPASWLDWLPGHVDPVAVTIYDDGVLQAQAFGVPLSEARVEELNVRRRRNEELFRWHVVPTASFARFIGLDMDRVIVGGNGTVASRVRSGPWPDIPTVGIASGAAPGRGNRDADRGVAPAANVDWGPPAPSLACGDRRIRRGIHRAAPGDDRGRVLDPGRRRRRTSSWEVRSASRPCSRSRSHRASTRTWRCR